MHALADGTLNEVDVYTDKRGLAHSRPTSSKRIYILEAHCTSYHCTNTLNGISDKGKIKNVSIQHIDCPDCGGALFWRKRVSKNEKEKS